MTGAPPPVMKDFEFIAMEAVLSTLSNLVVQDMNVSLNPSPLRPWMHGGD